MNGWTGVYVLNKLREKQEKKLMFGFGKDERKMALFTQYAVAAAEEAIEDSACLMRASMEERENYVRLDSFGKKRSGVFACNVADDDFV